MDSLTVPGNLDSLGAIASYVAEVSAAAGLDKKATYKLRLAVDEIATNIIVYGYEEAGIAGDVNLHAKIDDKSLTLSLEDTGIAFDPTQKALTQDLNQPLEMRPIGGLGIYLAIDGVDQFQYERIGECNRNILVVHRTTI
jgi:anti-sigma regulatory factor (Ser/Thr protein kinase)